MSLFLEEKQQQLRRTGLLGYWVTWLLGYMATWLLGFLISVAVSSPSPDRDGKI